MATILIVEDDQDIHEMVKKLLIQKHYQVLSAYSGTEAILQLQNQEVDLILLDLMIPGKNGESVIQKIKQRKNIPIIVVSAITSMEEKLKLFSLGADDYLTKPFHLEELCARIKVQLRHTCKTSKEFLRWKDLELNCKTYQAICNKKTLLLSKIEFQLLKTLLEEPERVFTKNILYEKVWNDDYYDDNTLNVHISHLRNKLFELNPKQEYIKTVWGIGYKMQ